MRSATFGGNLITKDQIFCARGILPDVFYIIVRIVVEGPATRPRFPQFAGGWNNWNESRHRVILYLWRRKKKDPPFTAGAFADAKEVIADKIR